MSPVRSEATTDLCQLSRFDSDLPQGTCILDDSFQIFLVYYDRVIGVLFFAFVHSRILLNLAVIFFVLFTTFPMLYYSYLRKLDQNVDENTGA